MLGTGLRGPGQVHFPEAPKDFGRDVGLTDTADILVLAEVHDGAGGYDRGWTTETADVPARIDPIGGVDAGDLVAEQVNEDTSHVVSLPDATTVTTSHRVSVGGTVFAVLAVHLRTDELLVRAEVRVA
jgi:hypothetical protein